MFRPVNAASRPVAGALQAAPTPELASAMSAFLERLAGQGYAESTMRGYGRATGALIGAMTEEGLGAADLDDERFEALRRRVLKGAPPSAATGWRHQLDRFRRHLIETAGAPPMSPPAADESPRARLRRAYESYLRRERALSEATIRHCLRFFERFLSFRFGPGLGDLAAITPDDVARFLEQLVNSRTAFRDKTPPTHLRALFKFLFWSGATRSNLADCVPRVKQRPMTRLPRALPQDAVQSLLDVARRNPRTGRRDFAMLLAVARLGLRAPEIVAVRLDDVDWRAGEILIRGKGRLHDRMPLPRDVGEALVSYIRQERRGESRSLFLTSKPPFRPFRDGQIVNLILRRAFSVTGLTPPAPYVGSHVLRHSLAMRMLKRGASVAEIGDVLRHRSEQSTRLYARVDLDALRRVASPIDDLWGEAPPARPAKPAGGAQ